MRRFRQQLEMMYMCIVYIYTFLAVDVSMSTFMGTMPVPRPQFPLVPYPAVFPLTPEYI